jgi:hypothetical protein
MYNVCMTRDELFALHQEICTRALVIMRHKSADYASGTDPFANFKRGEILGFATAEEGLMLRVVDKVSRISTFLKKGELKVSNETVEDSILDVINYMILLHGLLADKNNRKI